MDDFTKDVIFTSMAIKQTQRDKYLNTLRQVNGMLYDLARYSPKIEGVELDWVCDFIICEFVKKILEMTNHHQTKAARILDIQRTYLARLLNELEIRE